MAVAKNTTNENIESPPKVENFAELLKESIGEEDFEGRVVKGTVLSVDNDSVTIDVGLKSEGRIPLREFGTNPDEIEVKVDDIVDVFVERYEDRDGLIRLSREKARREESWVELEKCFKDNVRVNGVIFGRVKGGFIVDLAGAVAFLPGSQVDIRPLRDISPLMGSPQLFQILKMDTQRNNIVVSRRAVLEESRSEARSELISKLSEGQILEGVVKNITDYGAFIDLGGVDGLLHVTDIAWKRITHPSEVLQLGQTIKVQIIRFNSENQRISLGMKQLESDPWESVGSKYAIGEKFTGRVTNITDYGAFVELEPGVEGLVHVSEMSWTKKNAHPGKIVSSSQEVEVMVLDSEPEKRRISLGLKQCLDNPWESFAAKNPLGTEVEGEIKNITEFGLFIGLEGDIDGMAHLSDLSWEKTGEEALSDYKKGSSIKVKILEISIEKERISLGIKQLASDPFESGIKDLKKGDVVTCKVVKVIDSGVEVSVNNGVRGFIKKSEISRERSEQRPERFAPEEKLDAKVAQIDKTSRSLVLSIKALETQQAKAAMQAYGSTDSGASLGDILGAAIEEKQKKSKEEDTKVDKTDSKETKKKVAKNKEEDTKGDNADSTETKKKVAKTKEEDTKGDNADSTETKKKVTKTIEKDKKTSEKKKVTKKTAKKSAVPEKDTTSNGDKEIPKKSKSTKKEKSEDN